MRIIRQPLVDINGRDIMSGELLSKEELEKLNHCLDKYKSKQEEVKNRIRKTEKDGKVYVSGLGRVNKF